jgi:hypothetical protein
LNIFDSTFNGPLAVMGGKLTLKRVTMNNVVTVSNNVPVEALRVTCNAPVTAVADVAANLPFMAVQSLFNGLVTLSGYKVWFGYNTFNPTLSPNPIVPGSPASNLQATNCDSVLIGNIMNQGYPGGSVSIDIYEVGGTLKAYNNLVDGGSWGLQMISATGEIVNNSFSSGAIYVNGGGPVIFRSDIISTGAGIGPCITAVGSASQAVFVSYCDLNAAFGPQLVGVTTPPINCLLNVGPGVNGDGSLQGNSACINAGPMDPIYANNDANHTRNTMGYTGGPFFNPAYYTTNSPMVFFNLTGQQTVLAGLQTNIQVSVAASAGH